MIGVSIDLSELNGLRDLEGIVTSESADANRRLGAEAYAHAVSLATAELRSRRPKYLDALRFYEQDGVAVLELDAKALWIEDGMPPHNMLDALLASPKAKMSKDGKKYVVIPFDHSPGHGETNSTPHQMDLVNTVRREMKSRKIPWAKIERDSGGSPKLGRLHKFSIGHSPLKTGDGPGQGRGPVGDVRQGPNQRQLVGGGPGGGGTPFLAGVGVYQSAAPGGGVKRSVMTFRIASSDHYGQDRWEHPGLEPTNILGRTEKWAEDELMNRMVPELVERILARV